MRRPAFTLLELLIVLSLVVTLAALVVPIGFRQLAREQERALLEQLSTSLVMARDQASRQQVPVRVLVEQDGSTTTVVLEPVEPNADPNDQPEDESDPAGSEPTRSPSPGYGGVPVTPAFDPDTSEPGAFDDDPLGVDPLDEDRAVLLAMAWPDGSIEPMGQIEIGDVSDRKRRVEINPWSGRVRLVAVEPTNDPYGDPDSDGFGDSDPDSRALGEDDFGGARDSDGPADVEAPR